MIDELVIFDCDQGTPEWHEARRGVVTASCFADVLAKGEGKTRRKLLLTLAGEIISGEVEDGYSNKHMERGHEFESIARELYAFQGDADPQLVGFMRRGRIGASPDALIGTDGLLEIKSKLRWLQLDALERGVLPPEHRAQVQGQLLVSGRSYCDFVSYAPRLPLLIVRVERDEPYIATLKQALADFVGEMDALTTKYQEAA